MEGWVKLFRKFKEWEWYRDSNTKDLFIEIILTANFENKKWQGQIIHRGELVTSIEKIGNEIGLTRQQTRTSLNKLKSTNEITIQSNKHFTLIKVNKYNEYQESTNQITIKEPSDNHPITTTKEYKNKRINNTNLTVGNEKLFDDIKPNSQITQDWQYLALDLIEKLNVPANKKSSFFKVAKENPDMCSRALQFAVDFPNPKIRWNMFFVKINELRKNAKQLI